MDSRQFHNALTLWMSGVALIFSAIAIGQGVYQFVIQNRSDLLANCAFGRSAESRLETVFEPYDEYSTSNRYNLNTVTKCLVLNNGRKAVSVIKVRSVLTNDGQPFSEFIQPVSLYENDLLDNSKLPITLPPGESKEVNAWLKIDVGSLTAKAVSKCRGLTIYSDYDACFHNNGFSIANYIYVEPHVQYFGGQYEGVGLQFITNENMAATFEVSALRQSILAIKGKLAKNYKEETFRPTYNREGIYLERGYREFLEVP